MGKETNPDAIRAAREAADLTITQVCGLTNIARSTIYRLESSPKPRPSLHVLNGLAGAYGVETDSFLRERGHGD